MSSMDEQMLELRRICDQLESDALTLEQSLELYERGRALQVLIDAALTEAGQRMSVIQVHADGSQTPFVSKNVGRESVSGRTQSAGGDQRSPAKSEQPTAEMPTTQKKP